MKSKPISCRRSLLLLLKESAAQAEEGLGAERRRLAYRSAARKKIQAEGRNYPERRNGAVSSGRLHIPRSRAGRGGMGELQPGGGLAEELTAFCAFHSHIDAGLESGHMVGAKIADRVAMVTAEHRTSGKQISHVSSLDNLRQRVVQARGRLPEGACQEKPGGVDVLNNLLDDPQWSRMGPHAVTCSARAGEHPRWRNGRASDSSFHCTMNCGLQLGQEYSI